LSQNSPEGHRIPQCRFTKYTRLMMLRHAARWDRRLLRSSSDTRSVLTPRVFRSRCRGTRTRPGKGVTSSFGTTYYWVKGSRKGMRSRLDRIRCLNLHGVSSLICILQWTLPDRIILTIRTLSWLCIPHTRSGLIIIPLLLVFPPLRRVCVSNRFRILPHRRLSMSSSSSLQAHRAVRCSASACSQAY
jgi:hypothetical protein